MPRLPLRRLLGLLLTYEPSWFLEFTGGLGMVLWSLFAYLTDDLAIHGWGWIVPATGFFLLGPCRVTLILAFRRHYPLRVAAAFAGASWWGYLYIASLHTTGIIPQQGMMLSLITGDVLTLARFSIPCLERHTEAR